MVLLSSGRAQWEGGASPAAASWGGGGSPRFAMDAKAMSTSAPSLRFFLIGKSRSGVSGPANLKLWVVRECLRCSGLACPTTGSVACLRTNRGCALSNCALQYILKTGIISLCYGELQTCSPARRRHNPVTSFCWPWVACIAPAGGGPPISLHPAVGYRFRSLQLDRSSVLLPKIVAPRGPERCFELLAYGFRTAQLLIIVGSFPKFAFLDFDARGDRLKSGPTRPRALQPRDMSCDERPPGRGRTFLKEVS